MNPKDEETQGQDRSTSAPKTITVDRDALAQAVKIMVLAHQQGLFSKFTPDEAMRHLSVIVYLQDRLK